MLKLSRSAFLLAACAIAVPLAGCATGHGGGKGDTNYVARDVSTLYSAAKRTLFDEVERQHPYSVWARRAQLMSAFNYYLAKKYTDAVSSAQRFVTIHPGNSEAPYAQYLIAMSYYQQIADVSRDQAITQQASDAFGELIRRYPESRYAADARLKQDLINDHLAVEDVKGLTPERFRAVVDKYPTTTHAPEALERLVESNLALGLPDEARRVAAVLGHNYPETFWYRQSLRLLLAEQKKTGMWTAEGPKTKK